jgi:hypothetical protein
MITRIIDKTTATIVAELDDRGMFKGIDDETRDDIVLAICTHVREGFNVYSKEVEKNQKAAP